MKTSIIMTSYNYENFIAKAIESVIAQSETDWELIIVDDGSSDNSIDIIKDFCQKDERIKLFSHPDNKNHGLCASIKLGLGKAQNEWVAFLESDDFWANNYLKEKYKYLAQNPECTFIYNDVEFFGNDLKIKSKKNYIQKLHKIWTTNEPKDVFNDFALINVVPTFSCVMCRKDKLMELNFDTAVEACLDYWLWWQFSEKNLFGYINSKLTYWRIHSESYLKLSGKSLKHNIQHALFINKITKLFTRKPRFGIKTNLLKFPILSLPYYFLIYLKKFICNTLKKYI